MGSVVIMHNGGSDASAATAVSIDVPMTGRLIGISWGMAGDLDADADYLYAQLSFISASIFATNDARGVVDTKRLNNHVVTSGAVVATWNGYVQLPDVPVMQGERLYLHVTGASAVPFAVTLALHFNFDLAKRT